MFSSIIDYLSTYLFFMSCNFWFFFTKMYENMLHLTSIICLENIRFLFLKEHFLLSRQLRLKWRGIDKTYYYSWSSILSGFCHDFMQNAIVCFPKKKVLIKENFLHRECEIKFKKSLKIHVLCKTYLFLFYAWLM